jgi:hypothetical protein
VLFFIEICELPPVDHEDRGGEQAVNAAARVDRSAAGLHQGSGRQPSLPRTIRTGKTTTPPALGGLADVVLPPVWKYCNVTPQPQPGAVESAICLPPANPTEFFPDRLELSIYSTGAARAKAFNELRAADPNSAALVPGKGTCSRNVWNGDRTWVHATTREFGGHVFCYFDASQNAVIAWTHERLKATTHLDMIAVARIGGRGNQPNLFNWWNYWHSYLGKCGPLPHCVALLP